MKPPRIKFLRPACVLCHATTDGDSCGCADKMRTIWWRVGKCVPTYRPSHNAYLNRKIGPVRPTHRRAHA